MRIRPLSGSSVRAHRNGGIPLPITRNRLDTDVNPPSTGEPRPAFGGTDRLPLVAGRTVSGILPWTTVVATGPDGYRPRVRVVIARCRTYSAAHS